MALQAIPADFHFVDDHHKMCRVMAEVSREVLEIWSEIPFTAILTEDWSSDFEDVFPHCVGKNFGGFATVLSKPRVDKPPGDSRPVLRLNGIGTGDMSANVDIGDEPPILIFLRDLFQSKVALFCGWPSIPGGLVGRALEDAWQLTLARDPKRMEPMAFALVTEEDMWSGGVQCEKLAKAAEVSFFEALVEDLRPVIADDDSPMISSPG
eukprot:symbB.v1.2.013741.t1/scaffold978.1/size277179/2